MTDDLRVKAAQVDAELNRNLASIADSLEHLLVIIVQRGIQHDPEVRRAFQQCQNAASLDTIFPQPGESEEQAIKRWVQTGNDSMKALGAAIKQASRRRQEFTEKPNIGTA